MQKPGICDTFVIIIQPQQEMKYEDIELIDNEEKHNFELWIDGSRAFIDYKKRGNTVYILHTEVPQELEGRGVAAAMVEKALRFLDQHQLRLVPLCSYTQTFLKRHPEWNYLTEDRKV